MTTVATEAPRTGTQSLERAALLLRVIASRAQIGWGLRELAQHCELEPATVHRMLKCMVTERLVQQRSTDSRYFIGPLNFELGLSVPNRPELMEATNAALRRLVRRLPKINALAFLRSEDDCVCIGRAGTVAYTENSSRVGQRFPLLNRASGVAMVAAMRTEDARGVCARNRKRLAHLGAEHLARVDDMLKASQRNGYTLSEGMLWHGVNLIAVAFGQPGDPVGSVTVSGSAADFTAQSMHKLLPDLHLAMDTLTEHARMI